MKTKILVVLGTVLFLVLLVVLNEWSKGPLAWCVKDRDTCIIDAMTKMRTEKEADKDKAKKEFEQKLVIIDNQYDPGINALKPMLSVGAAVKEVTEGDKRNVAEDFLTLKNSLVPMAYADGADEVSLSESTINVPEVSKKELLQGFLASKNAPFASVDVYSIAKESGITEDEMLLLLAITGKESNWGTAYTSTKGGVRRSEPVLGLEYNNATGMKNPRVVLEGCPANTPIPDENGMWLQRYDSWEQYFSCYFRQIRNGYFNKGLTTAAEMSTIYVGSKTTHGKPGWYNDVNHFKSLLQAAIN